MASFQPASPRRSGQVPAAQTGAAGAVRPAPAVTPRSAAQRIRIDAVFGDGSRPAAADRPAVAVQRRVIAQAQIPGMTANLDTDQIDAAKLLIQQLVDGGKLASLRTLYVELLTDPQDANLRTLGKHVEKILLAPTSSVAENKTSGTMEKAAIKLKYWTSTATDNVVQAGLRMWVTGDPTLGITWNMIGKHLRGRLTVQEYEQIGTMSYLLQDQRNNTHLVDTFSAAQNELEGRTLLDNARNQIRGALDALPDHDGMSYRQSGVASGAVYGGSINVGDYIRDTTFWSTSALRISGSAGGWGDDGTASAPKVYFLINGTTGKYISKYAAQEQGQHEVLFKDRVTFQVNKIANFKGATFFVHVTEVDATLLPLNQAIKNPYNGAPAG